MGTHPIFESDFDCLTEFGKCESERPNDQLNRSRNNRMPTRNSGSRRSLESNRQERQVAFSNARSLFDSQSGSSGSRFNTSEAVPRERGDEEYGPIVYSKATVADADEKEQAKSINDLIKNFEALSNNSLRDRGRSFSQARVTRSASPVK